MNDQLMFNNYFLLILKKFLKNLVKTAEYIRNEIVIESILAIQS